MKIEVSNGEILDKHTILKIKLEKISDPVKVSNLNKEWLILTPIVEKIVNGCSDPQINEVYQEMYDVNLKLWIIEDDIRDCERVNDFSEKFIKLARDVYWTNDDRNLVKKKIDNLTGSNLTEEKSYLNYKDKK
jgi:hypothetical protein